MFRQACSLSHPIVVRWRLYLQSFSFLINHIPGKPNYLGDYLFKMYGSTQDPLPIKLPEETPELLPIDQEPNDDEPEIPYTLCSPAALFAKVHGGRALHQGLKLTWDSLNKNFPGHTVSFQQLKKLMDECPLCQKVRYGATPLLSHPATIRTLNSNERRLRIGIDHRTITPPDEQGRQAVLIIHEHWSKFTALIPMPDYSALMQYMCRYGSFAELASDPGSAFLAEVIQQLNDWLGVYHRVSLVDRHESNSCESSIIECVRHIRTIALDYLLEHYWSRQEVLDYVMFLLNARPHSETGVSPFILKFGTTDGIIFRPDPHERYQGTNEYIKYLDSTLATVRQVAQEALDKDSNTRQSSNLLITTSYQHGDFLPYLR